MWSTVAAVVSASVLLCTVAFGATAYTLNDMTYSDYSLEMTETDIRPTHPSDVEGSGLDDTPHNSCSLCGANTDCHTPQDLIPLCSCKPGFTGKPFDRCIPIAKCSIHGDCPSDRACHLGVCVNPCLSACGYNTDCRVVNHTPACSCRQGFVWKPVPSCIPASTVTTKRYYLSDIQATWVEAMDFCHGQRMALVAVENSQDQKDLQALLQKRDESAEPENWWTSGALIDDRYYAWMSTGAVIGYTNWANPNPEKHSKVNNGLRYYCIELRPTGQYRWNDQLCDTKQKFICQYYESM